MHLDCRTSYTIKFRPDFRLVRRRSRVVLNWIDVAANYEVVLRLLLPKVEVRPVELPNAHLR
jgi:hypothetical protein